MTTRRSPAPPILVLVGPGRGSRRPTRPPPCDAAGVKAGQRETLLATPATRGHRSWP